MYGSNYLFKFFYLQGIIKSFNYLTNELTTNPKSLTQMVFSHFLRSNCYSSTKNTDLYKSQFRPLRKGISSMLRLHATGAVAMPTEVRLQVLASSRDVIHS